MELNLFQATWVAGLLFAGLGALFAAPSSRVAVMTRGFPRSKLAAMVTMGLGGAWTLYMVAHLGEANYGEFKRYLFVGFALVGVASFKYAPDFLSVRGACILYLLLANAVLDGAFGHYEEPLRLFMIAPVYVGIALSLYLAYCPFRLRDFFGWLFAVPGRSRVFGAGLFAYGIFVCCLAFAY